MSRNSFKFDYENGRVSNITINHYYNDKANRSNPFTDMLNTIATLSFMNSMSKNNSVEDKRSYELRENKSSINNRIDAPKNVEDAVFEHVDSEIKKDYDYKNIHLKRLVKAYNVLSIYLKFDDNLISDFKTFKKDCGKIYDILISYMKRLNLGTDYNNYAFIDENNGEVDSIFVMNKDYIRNIFNCVERNRNLKNINSIIMSNVKFDNLKLEISRYVLNKRPKYIINMTDDYTIILYEVTYTDTTLKFKRIKIEND